METVDLNFKKQGNGPSLVILHGLFGSLDNWQTMAKNLAPHFTIICPDLRNHGKSPKTSRIDYALMAKDILRMMDKLEVNTFHIAGHSMGGKVALQLLNTDSYRINKALIMDIAPKSYGRGHDEIFDAMFALPIHQIKTRQEADEFMKPKIPDWAVRQFILKNLDRDKDGNFFWKINLPVLYNDYSNITQGIIPSGLVHNEILFLKGSKSHYIDQNDIHYIRQNYEHSRIMEIQDAGHWIHADKPNELLKIMLNFFQAEN